MAVPRNRLSNARKNKRRSHLAKKCIQAILCKNCKNTMLSHRICPSCGFYGEKQIVEKKEDVKK